MKELIHKYKYYALILFAAWSFFSGCALFYDSFGKPEGMESNYPLFFLTISLLLIYILPMLALIRYLANRFAISKSVINLSWIMSATAAMYFSDLGHTALAVFWLNLIKPSEEFLSAWGAAISAPFAEEFGKGLAVLLVLLILNKMDLKNALVSGLIVGLGFQIIEDCIFTFQEIFIVKADGFSMLIERIAHAAGTHWTFTLVFAVGMVALLAKHSGLSKAQGAFWLAVPVLGHFLVNSPFNEDITSKSGYVTILILCYNLCMALAAYHTVDKLEHSKKSAV